MYFIRTPIIYFAVEFAVLISLASLSEGSVYNKTNSGLLVFPHDIPDDVISIDLGFNHIEIVDYIEAFGNLINVSLKYNRLVEFPDFSNVSNSLEVLNLAYHKIQTIPADRLDKLVKLRILQIGFGPLLGIPDVSGPSNTLYHLGVEYTAISGFPQLPVLGKSFWSMYLYGNPGLTKMEIKELEIYPNLEMMYLYETNLTSIPNLCQINRQRIIRLNLNGMILKCDTNFLWLVVAMATGHMTFDDGAPKCSSDGGATVTEWNEIDIKRLSREDSDIVHQYYMELDDPDNFHCYPTVMTATPGESLISCAARCLSSPECVLFNSKTSGICSLTSLRPGNPTVFKDNFPWMSVE